MIIKTIKKDNLIFTVKEQKDYWLISRNVDKLSLDYTIAKEICKDEEALKKYIEKEKIFWKGKINESGS